MTAAASPPRVGLAIAEIVFYVLAILPAILVTLRHGFSRSAGWFFLILLALIRIAGGALELVAQYGNTNTSILITAGILSNVGLSPLLFVMLAIIRRLHNLLEPPFLPRMSMRVLALGIIAALVLSINGGIRLYDAETNIKSGQDTQANINNVNSGHSLIEAAASVFLVVYVFQSFIGLLIYGHRHRARFMENYLLGALILSIPPLFVRILYLMLSAVDYTNPSFVPIFASDSQSSVYPYAFMSLMMEFIVVIIYLTGALLTPKAGSADMVVEDGAIMDRVTGVSKGWR